MNMSFFILHRPSVLEALKTVVSAEDVCLCVPAPVRSNSVWVPPPPYPSLLDTLFSPPPAESSLQQAVPGQRLARKAEYLDAVALGVAPFVAVVAGQVHITRGATAQREGSLIFRGQQFPCHLQLLHLVLRVPGHRRGHKGHVVSPDIVLQPWRGEGWSGSGPGWSSPQRVHRASLGN